MINKLYTEYIQKSRIFLYPLLEIKKGSEAVPIESYVSWDNVYEKEDGKFICVYPVRNDDVFKRFEKSKLMNHKLFDQYFETDSDKSVYVFDFEEHRSDWNYFLNGQYSSFSTSSKNIILKFFINNKNNYHHINSYLNPELYYEKYSELLGVDEKTLREVKELCSLPNLTKENLVAQVKQINIFRSF